MAKKNSHKDTSGVEFDTHSKMVMSQGGTQERMKEKISAVRAVVPNKSNNEIVLVLQHFENCVDRAVQAFLDGSAVEILKEWNVTGKKKPKKKKKPKPQPEPPVEPAPPENPPAAALEEAVNGFHANGSVLDGDSIDSLSEQLDSASLDTAELDSEPAMSETTGAEAEVESLSSAPSPTTSQQGGTVHPQGPRPGKSRHRTNSHSSHPPASSSLPNIDDGQHGSSGSARKIAPNIDRSVKDLQRCTASLTRYRVVVKDEMDSSIKRLKQTFAELQSCLGDREVTLFEEMDKVKAEAMAILDSRQKRAEQLRRLSDQSASMSEDQLTELRADIKHFVSERKYDEDLGKAVKFAFELEPLKNSIAEFGSVYHPQAGYSNRSRCSSTSSSITGPAPLETPPPSQTESSSGDSRPSQPYKQSFQGNRRHVYHAGPRYNGNTYHDRNPNRSYRYQGGRGAGPQGDGVGSGPSASSSTHSSYNSSRGPSSYSSSTSSSYRQDRPNHNGLPQRPPRTQVP